MENICLTDVLRLSMEQFLVVAWNTFVEKAKLCSLLYQETVPCWDIQQTNLFCDMSHIILWQETVFRAMIWQLPVNSLAWHGTSHLLTNVWRVSTRNCIACYLHGSKHYYHNKLFMTCHASTPTSPTNSLHHCHERIRFRCHVWKVSHIGFLTRLMWEKLWSLYLLHQRVTYSNCLASA